MRTVDLTPSPMGDDPRFSGTVLGADHLPPADPRLHAFVVQFEPGARTAWHSHVHGQLLICTQGRGLVGTRDGRVLPLEQGAAVWTDPGEEHWHGAVSGEPMTHIAVQTTEPGIKEVNWLDPVEQAELTEPTQLTEQIEPPVQQEIR